MILGKIRPVFIVIVPLLVDFMSIILFIVILTKFVLRNVFISLFIIFDKNTIK